MSHHIMPTDWQSATLARLLPATVSHKKHQWASSVSHTWINPHHLEHFEAFLAILSDTQEWDVQKQSSFWTIQITRNAGRTPALKCSSINDTGTYTANTYSKLRVRKPPSFTHYLILQELSSARPEDQTQGTLHSNICRSVGFSSLRPLQQFSKRARFVLCEKQTV